MTTGKLSLKLLSIVYALILISWTIYRSYTQLPEYIDELLAKPLIWITPVIFVMLWRKIKFSSFGFITPNIKIVLISAATGIILSLLQIVPNFFKGATQINSFDTQSSLVIILVYLGTAISEEVLFRGFLLQHFRQKLPTSLSIIISSILFAIIHLPILLFINHTFGTDLIVGFYILFVSSLVFGMLFVSQKTIWSPIIAHFLMDLLLTIF